MSDHDIDRIRHARDAMLVQLRSWVRVNSTRPLIAQPVVIEFCAADFCVEVSL